MDMPNAPGKLVKVNLTNGDTVKGLCINYTTALDNEPDPASIDVRTGKSGGYCLYENEIESIEEITD